MLGSTPGSAERRAAWRVRWRERLIGAAAAVLRDGRARRAEWERGAPVLLYHRVYPDRVPPHDPFGVTRARFERQVRWLGGRFTLCTVSELLERLQGMGDAGRLAAITFDDGFDCTYREAWPVLRGLGIRATLFVDTGRLDGPRPALQRGEVQALAAEGWEIASHSVSHVDLSELRDPDALYRELSASRADLEAFLPRPVSGFAPPYGRYSAAMVAAVRAAGYRYMCTCRQHRTNVPNAAAFLVDRVEVNRGDSTARFARKVTGAFARVYAAWYRLNPRTRHWMRE